MAKIQKMHEVRLPISGLTGPRCALQVEDALRTVVGVSSALVNPVSGHATVVYDPARVRFSAIETAIDTVGCGTPRPGRAVLRLRAAGDAQPPAPREPGVDETTVSIKASSGVAGEDGILQRIITAAVERVGEPEIPVDGSCPGRGVGQIDRLA